uniref:Uncharacterized protein n=1 Tax=Romanomermis culicivorax TaxID=13658 RepID=A0A915I1E2_ROMCU
VARSSPFFSDLTSILPPNCTGLAFKFEPPLPSPAAPAGLFSMNSTGGTAVKNACFSPQMQDQDAVSKEFNYDKLKINHMVYLQVIDSQLNYSQ